MTAGLSRRSRRSLITTLAPVLALAGMVPPVRGQQATPLAGPDLRGVTPLSLAGERVASFRTYVADALTRYDMPGAAVAVVQGGEVVLLEGFGVTGADGEAQVTPETMFMIGSITKSLTTMLAAALVDAGEIAWETRLVDLLPGFATGDPALTERLTIQDAFCNCSGLPGPNLELYFGAGPQTPAAVTTALADVEPVAPFGEQFIYSNLLVAAGGYALGLAVDRQAADPGRAYDAALRQWVLEPIGMPRSTFEPVAVAATGDYALPHAVDLSGDLRTLPLSAERWVAPVRPAGGLWSNGREMARYLQTELAAGVAPDGAVVASAANLSRTWQPQVAVPDLYGGPSLVRESMAGYGLGWMTGDYHGLSTLSHSGGTTGFAARLTLLPEADLGIVVLTNALLLTPMPLAFAHAVQFRLFEVLFDLPLEFETALATTAPVRPAVALGQLDPAAVAPYAGAYVEPTLGEVTVSLQGDALVLDTGEVTTTLSPLAGTDADTPVYLFHDPPLSLYAEAYGVSVSFAGAPDAPQLVITVPSNVTGAQEEMVFRRVDTSATPTV